MPKVIHWIRHGEAEHNIVAQNARDAGLSDAEKRRKISDEKLADAPLTTKGTAQAEHLNRALKETNIAVEFIVVSPLKRTLQTATLAFGQTKMLAHSDARERMSSLKSERRSDLADLSPQFPHCDFSLCDETDSGWTGASRCAPSRRR